jgi:hypothetical protein
MTEAKVKTTFISYVREITKEESVQLIHKFHYSKVLPRLNKVFLGGFTEEDELVATITLGWGVRPVHTIKKLFPSLDSKDYYEIGKMCLDDKMPRNSESQFLSKCSKYVKANYPQIKIIFTWADGMLGKAGYVYQASNYLYGGFIWTDTYFTSEGEKVHPRMTGKIGGRPNKEFMEEHNWKHYRGKQFRYIYFLCDKKEKKRLLAESSFKWQINNAPKETELEWKVKTPNGWEFCSKPTYNPFALDFYKKKKSNIN